MTNSLEITTVSEPSRAIRVWIKNTAASSIIEIGFENEDHTKIQCGGPDHTAVVVPQKNPESCRLCVTVLQGSVEIGLIEINHSWKINDYFAAKYQDEVDALIQSQFDLSLISQDFLKDLRQQDLFQSTGEHEFSATGDLRNIVSINGKVTAKTPWLVLSQNDTLSCDLNLTTPAQSPVIEAPKENLEEIEWCRDFDPAFIHDLDTRFHEFVAKKLRNKHILWHDCLFSGFEIPYAWKIRIQAQLLDNAELIKNKHVVDLGCDRGQFLWPCLAIGCLSITGVQPISIYNDVINEALLSLKQQQRAQAITGNAYDIDGIKKILQGKDTLMMLGLLYHLNNHYELLETVTQSDVKNIIIDIKVRHEEIPHYQSSEASISWKKETQGIDTNGWELSRPRHPTTLVGRPNASWLTLTLEHLGWRIKSSKMISYLRVEHPNMAHRGIITAVRD